LMPAVSASLPAASVSGPAMFQRFLPYAASYGLLHPWAKWFEKEGWTDLPPYFEALAADDGGVAAFVAMTSASSSAGGSAAGAAGAGAGAAGGGASGAG